MLQKIAEMVRSCELCRKLAWVPLEPLMRSEFPSRLSERVGSDLFYFKDCWYLLLVDYYSCYIEVAMLKELYSLVTIDHTKSIFARHGIPELLVSENGPQYSSIEFQRFVTGYGFKHITSLPKH